MMYSPTGLVCVLYDLLLIKDKHNRVRASTRLKLLLFSREIRTRHLYLRSGRPAMDRQQEEHVCQ